MLNVSSRHQGLPELAAARYGVNMIHDFTVLADQRVQQLYAEAQSQRQAAQCRLQKATSSRRFFRPLPVFAVVIRLLKLV